MTTETANHCARHPQVETELQCGKCGTLICPRCIVQTPVGARCRDCAKLKRPPMYAVSGGSLTRLAGVAVAAGVGVGALWGLLLPSVVSVLGFFVIFAGLGLGYVMSTAVDRLTHKRGPMAQGAAVGAVVIAYLVHNLIVASQPVLTNDVWGLVVVGVAAVVSWNQLR